MHPHQYDHVADPDALSDEGIAFDIAELIENGRKGGPGAFFNMEQAHALERLARWANANGYQAVPRETHEALERGEELPAVAVRLALTPEQLVKLGELPLTGLYAAGCELVEVDPAESRWRRDIALVQGDTRVVVDTNGEIDEEASDGC